MSLSVICYILGVPLTFAVVAYCNWNDLEESDKDSPAILAKKIVWWPLVFGIFYPLVVAFFVLILLGMLLVGIVKLLVWLFEAPGYIIRFLVQGSRRKDKASCPAPERERRMSRIDYPPEDPPWDSEEPNPRFDRVPGPNY